MTARTATRRTILAGGLMLPAFCVQAQGAPSVAPGEAAASVAAGRIVLIDIRSPAEWADTGVPTGAMTLDADGAAFEPRLAGLRLDNPGKSLVLIDRTGGQAAILQSKLAARGWRDVRIVAGGMLGPGGWLAAKLPVTAR